MIYFTQDELCLDGVNYCQISEPQIFSISQKFFYKTHTKQYLVSNNHYCGLRVTLFISPSGST